MAISSTVAFGHDCWVRLPTRSIVLATEFSGRCRQESSELFIAPLIGCEGQDLVGRFRIAQNLKISKTETATERAPFLWKVPYKQQL